jgi:hypothetical protein
MCSKCEELAGDVKILSNRLICLSELYQTVIF